MVLLFCAVLVLVPIIALRGRGSGVDPWLDESFDAQIVEIDGARYAASDLDVLYHHIGSVQTSDRGRVMTMDAERICRAPDGGYLLGIAQYDRTFGPKTLTWTWRRLTEERARHALMHDEKAYREAFGVAPDQETASRS